MLIVACDMVSVASSTAPVATFSPTTTIEPAPTIEPTTTIPSESTEFDLGPLTPRTGHSVIWTGEEVIVWGGESFDDPGTPFSDGAAFDPVDNTWRLTAESPLSPRTSHAAAWTGAEMLIVGGFR